MAYDNKTYGASPFVHPAATTARTTVSNSRRETQAATSDTEALSDQLGDQLEVDSPDGTAPALPTDYAAIKPRSAALSWFYIPKGRVTGLNLLGEALGWLMAWGTVGFFRAYVPVACADAFR